MGINNYNNLAPIFSLNYAKLYSFAFFDGSFNSVAVGKGWTVEKCLN